MRVTNYRRSLYYDYYYQSIYKQNSPQIEISDVKNANVSVIVNFGNYQINKATQSNDVLKQLERIEDRLQQMNKSLTSLLKTIIRLNELLTLLNTKQSLYENRFTFRFVFNPTFYPFYF